MSDSTEMAIRRWLDREVPEHKLVTTYWFGCEPLLCLHTLLSLGRHAVPLCERLGIAFVEIGNVALVDVAVVVGLRQPPMHRGRYTHPRHLADGGIRADAAEAT